MDNEIKVSILCLSYNHERYISRTLDSFLMQKVSFPYEIIVCNDASVDGTLNIINAYAEKHPNVIKVINHRENLGGSRSLLECMKLAKGQYVAACEGDDFWTDENKLRIQADFLDKNPQYIGCVHNICLVDKDGNPMRKQRLFWLSGKKVFSLSDFDAIHLPGHASSFMRRNLFLDKDFDLDKTFLVDNNIGDRTLFLTWLSYGDIYKLPQKMSAYRVVRKGDNITSKNYRMNRMRTLAEFTYLCKLEKYAALLGHGDLHFEKRKRMLFADSLINAVRYGGENKKVPKQILEKTRNKPLCILSVPYNLLKKVLIKIFMVG